MNTEQIQKELNEFEQRSQEGMNYLKFEDGKLTAFSVDTTREFEVVTDTFGNGKKRIPVLKEGRKLFWDVGLNNPILKEVLTELRAGRNSFVIIRTGKAKDTRYQLVK